MREQLSQALTNQQSLTIERDQVREQAKLATERADRLERQLDLLRKTHGKSVDYPLSYNSTEDRESSYYIAF